MEDEYKFVCALSNGAAFDDVEWPRTQFQGHNIIERRISRKRCIQSTSCLVLVLGFQGRRIEWRYFRFDKIQDGVRLTPSSIYKNGHNFATGLPIDVTFASTVGFSGSADLMVPFSMTLSHPEPQFQGHSVTV